MLRREGDVWTVAFEGTSVLIKDSRGLQDIARLLARPGLEMHVRDLIGAATPRAAVRAQAEDLREPSDLGPMLDEQARRTYRQQLAALDDDIAEAENFGDAERADRAQSERTWIVAQFSAAYGLGGRTRACRRPGRTGQTGREVASATHHRPHRTGSSSLEATPAQLHQDRYLLRLSP